MKGIRLVIVQFFYFFYRLEKVWNKSWGKWRIGRENPITCVDKGSPLLAIGVNVVRITTGKLLTALLWKTGYSETSMENALLIYSGDWRSRKENNLKPSIADEWNSSCPYSDRKWKIRSYWCLISVKPLGRTFQSVCLRLNCTHPGSWNIRGTPQTCPGWHSCHLCL